MAVYMALRLSRRGAPKVCMNAACITAYQCPRCCHTFQLTSDRLLPAASHLFQQQRCSSGNASDGRDIRMNPLNIQMISKALHKQIFGEETPNVEDAIHLAQQHLESQGLWGKPGSILPNVDVQLPPLVGEDIDEHFRIIAEEQSKPYLELAIRLAESTIPAMPRRWRFEPGWTKYVGKEAFKVDCPDDDALVFDVEVCVSESERPVLAAAVSDKCWYSWVSERLASSEDFYTSVQQRAVLDDLIPLETRAGGLDAISGSWQQRLVVGHNVSYDRARVKEQYLIKVL